MVAKPYMKIGISRDVKARLAQVQTGCPVKINRVVYFEVGSSGSAERIEKLLHERYVACRTWGEWFIYSAPRFKAIVSMFPDYMDNNGQLARYKGLIFDCYGRASSGELIALLNEIDKLTNKSIKRKLTRLAYKYINKLKRKQDGKR
jgi:hypothetical protein